MDTTQEFAMDSADPPTFAKVWKMFQETREEIREMSRETDRKFQETREQIQATDRQIAATDRQMKATDKKVGELTNRFGDMVEHMIVPNLLDKFKALGFEFEVATRDYKITDEKNNVFVEIDAFLEHGDKVMIVEIKATPSAEDISGHVRRMEKLRKRADARGDARKYLGAVAGVVVSDSVKNRALKSGFFVVVPSGDTFSIIKPEGRYHIREW
jgi:predicted nuclease with TOPRIM domain